MIIIYLTSFILGLSIGIWITATTTAKGSKDFVILKSQLDKYYVQFEKRLSVYRFLRRSGDGYILDSQLFATPFFSKEEAVKAAEDFIKSQQLVKV